MRMHGNLALMIVVALVASACGEDDAPPPPPPPAAKPPPPRPAPGRPGAKGAKAAQLQPRAQIEQRVSCPSPEKPTGPKCNKDAPNCEAGLYCLPIDKDHFCEPCPERDRIRHEFRDRDFVADQVRDPFQSFVIVQPGLVEDTGKKVEGPCNRPDQFVATNYSYLDLKLVGIVSKGTQRKVLMMDRGNLGHIIRRGDCVGKEKAVVKDIGTGYVTFVIQPDPEDKTNRVPEERSVQLHPKGLQVAPQPTLDAVTPTAPIVAPPGGSAPPPPAPTTSAPPPPSSAP